MIFAIDFRVFRCAEPTLRVLIAVLQAQGHSCVIVADCDQDEIRHHLGDVSISASREATNADVWIGAIEHTPVQMPLPAVPLPKKTKRKPKAAPVTETDLNDREREVMAAIVGDATLSQICHNVPALARDLVGLAMPGVDVVREVKQAGAWNRNNPTKAWTSNGNKGLTSWIGRAKATEQPVQRTLFLPHQRTKAPAPPTVAQMGDKSFLDRLLAKNPEVQKVLGESDVY